MVHDVTPPTSGVIITAPRCPEVISAAMPSVASGHGRGVIMTLEVGRATSVHHRCCIRRHCVSRRRARTHTQRQRRGASGQLPAAQWLRRVHVAGQLLAHDTVMRYTVTSGFLLELPCNSCLSVVAAGLPIPVEKQTLLRDCRHTVHLVMTMITLINQRAPWGSRPWPSCTVSGWPSAAEPVAGAPALAPAPAVVPLAGVPSVVKYLRPDMGIPSYAGRHSVTCNVTCGSAAHRHSTQEVSNEPQRLRKLPDKKWQESGRPALDCRTYVRALPHVGVRDRWLESTVKCDPWGFP